MRVSARTRANRLNAKRSTGPRSSAGKARVARNAVKHGLSMSISVFDGGDPQIERMTKGIAGEGTDPMREILARQIALAHLDLLRIRSARQIVIGRNRDGTTDERMKLVAEAAPPKNDGLKTETLSSPDGVKDANFYQEFPERADQLLRLDRYERRALSRRRMAIRAFDAYCAEQSRAAKDAGIATSEQSLTGVYDSEPRI